MTSLCSPDYSMVRPNCGNRVSGLRHIGEALRNHSLSPYPIKAAVCTSSGRDVDLKMQNIMKNESCILKQRGKKHFGN